MPFGNRQNKRGLSAPLRRFRLRAKGIVEQPAEPQATGQHLAPQDRDQGTHVAPHGSPIRLA
jgi:hypothetical protein